MNDDFEEKIIKKKRGGEISVGVHDDVKDVFPPTRFALVG